MIELASHSYCFSVARVRAQAVRFACAAALSLLSKTAAGQTIAVAHRASLDSFKAVGAATTAQRVGPTGIQNVALNADSLTLGLGEFIVRSTGTVPRLDRSESTSHYDLPLRILAPTTDKTTAQFTMAVKSPGLGFAPADGLFAGWVYVGLDDSTSRDRVVKLASPITVQMRVSDPKFELTPSELFLNHTNVPFDSVRVSGAAMPGDSVYLFVQPTFAGEQRFGLAVNRPSLNMHPSPNSIAGFGFEKARVIVASSFLVSRDSYTVTLAAHKSKTEAGSVIVSANHPASTYIPSSGIGLDTIDAQGGPFQDAHIIIHYVFPYLFLVFAVLGGIVGAVAKGLSDTDKSKLSVKTFGLGILGGISTGLIVAAGSALGINLTSVTVTAGFSEGVAFFVAAVGAFGGIHILAK